MLGVHPAQGIRDGLPAVPGHLRPPFLIKPKDTIALREAPEVWTIHGETSGGSGVWCIIIVTMLLWVTQRSLPPGRCTSAGVVETYRRAGYRDTGRRRAQQGGAVADRDGAPGPLGADWVRDTGRPEPRLFPSIGSLRAIPAVVEVYGNMDQNMRAAKERAFQLFDAGQTVDDVSAELGLHRVVAWNWHRQWERERKPRVEVESLASDQVEDGTAGNPPDVPTEATEGEPPTPPSLLPGSVWQARIYRTEVYGVFAEVLDRTGAVIGRGLVHRTKMFADGETPHRRWMPDEFLPVGSHAKVRVVRADNPQRLELSTAGFLSVPNHEIARAERSQRDGTILRLRGRHSPAVVVRALQVAIAAIEGVQGQVSVLIDVVRVGEERHGA